MKISIVVPAFNEEKLIGESLRSIREALGVFEAKGWPVELIVCDNNSTDRTGELARAAGAKVVFEPVNQIARARNSGAAAATGDWLIFVDADSHPSRELFTEAAAAIESGRYLAGGSTMKLDGPYPFAKFVTGIWNRVSRAMKWVAGSFSFIETTAFREIGGFSHELFASEEIDLSQRLKVLARRRGKKMIILHRHPLVTSARKIHLYTPREHFQFLLRTVFSWKKTLRNREACSTWYDGRR